MYVFVCQTPTKKHKPNKVNGACVVFVVAGCVNFSLPMCNVLGLALHYPEPS